MRRQGNTHIASQKRRYLGYDFGAGARYLVAWSNRAPTPSSTISGSNQPRTFKSAYGFV
ncbi:hypothetical protein BN1012_Phect2815 [Candidatus Phaeomarinobacter ectocarpi]|uniref:Uncharacterized protein n=1 Tax=Candidatus Phaeomarinibacter ectocarpi TaxID=1458461 RepID=X5MAR1_9HYPH|nr:hypothetical protein BN1012_Phect2815 [Candidatus Phaeomarinobacter ectocarpi]